MEGETLSKQFDLIKSKHEGMCLIEPETIRAYLEEHGFSGDLGSLPLMTKQDISLKLKTADTKKIHSFAYTGGSYGEPFRIPYSKQRANVRTASFKYFNELAGYTLGEPFLMIAAKEKPRWKQLLRNEYRFVPKSLTEDSIRNAVQLLIRKQIKVIIGFPSVIFELADFIHRNKVLHQLKTVVFTSEPIDELKRSFIRKALHCNVIDRYSNEEVGLIAQQKDYGGVYYTNRYNIVVELLDEHLRPVKEGETGRVVVTDLKADVVPIVRYDTGDLAVAKEYKNGQLMAISRITGRIAEQLFCTNGNPVAPLILGPLIHKPMSEANCFNQFQFAQTGTAKYELRIRKGENLPGPVLAAILRNLMGVLGKDAVVVPVFLTDIKPQPSGKRPIYKNELISNVQKQF